MVGEMQVQDHERVTDVFFSTGGCVSPSFVRLFTTPVSFRCTLALGKLDLCCGCGVYAVCFSVRFGYGLSFEGEVRREG